MRYDADTKYDRVRAGHRGIYLRGARAVQGVGAGAKHLETAVFFFPVPRLLLPRGARAVRTLPHSPPLGKVKRGGGLS